MRDVVIVSAVRTAIGSLGGAFKNVSAVELGKIAAVEAIKRAGIDPAIIDEAVIGNVLSSGLGQNVARQVIIQAGVPKEVPAFSINKRLDIPLYLSSVSGKCTPISPSPAAPKSASITA